LPTCSTTSGSADLGDVTAFVSNTLSSSFTSSNGHLGDIVAAIYSGKGDLSIIPAQTSENGEATPFAKFFAGGKWLIPDKGDMGAIVTRLFGNWNTVLVGTICRLILPIADTDIETSTDWVSSTSTACVYLGKCKITPEPPGNTDVLTAG
jgi:hypothetical protein